MASSDRRILGGAPRARPPRSWKGRARFMVVGADVVGTTEGIHSSRSKSNNSTPSHHREFLARFFHQVPFPRLHPSPPPFFLPLFSVGNVECRRSHLLTAYDSLSPLLLRNFAFAFSFGLSFPHRERIAAPFLSRGSQIHPVEGE